MQRVKPASPAKIIIAFFMTAVFALSGVYFAFGAANEGNSEKTFATFTVHHILVDGDGNTNEILTEVRQGRAGDVIDPSNVGDNVYCEPDEGKLILESALFEPVSEWSLPVVSGNYHVWGTDPDDTPEDITIDGTDYSDLVITSIRLTPNPQSIVLLYSGEEVESPEDNGDTGSSNITVETEATTINVTVPTNAAILFKADGTNVYPSNYAITNNNALTAITLDGINFSGANGWSLTHENDTFQADVKKFALWMGMRGNDLTAMDVANGVSFAGNTEKRLRPRLLRS